MAAPVVLPQVVIDAVVEVIVFKMLELAAAGREKLFTDANVIVHRAADVEKQQNLDRVVAFGAHVQIEPAGVTRRAGDGAFEIELFGCPLAGKTAQAAQGDLDVARAELDAVVEVAVFALFPDLDRRAVLASATHPDPLGMRPAMTEG